MLRWLLILGGALVGLGVLVTLIGFLVPQDHVASSRAAFAEPPDSVWAAVRDMASYPAWWSQLDSSERDPSASVETWIQRGPRVGTLPIIVEVDEPPRRLVTRMGEGLPFGGTWTYQVMPDGGGSVLTITEDGQVYNPVFRFVSRFVMGYHGTMDSYLRDLGEHFGEAVDAEHLEEPT